MSDAQARRRPAWGRLGEELRRLRRQARISQDAMGTVLGVHRSTIERIETGGANGGSPPSLQAVLDWAAATEVGHPDVPMLRALQEAAYSEHRPYREWGTVASIQAAIQADEATALTIRNFNPWGVPGLLQTSRYARALLEMDDVRGLGDIAEAVAIRITRQSKLDEAGSRFEFLVTEEGLRRRVGSLAVHGAQLAHLADAAAEPAVTLRVIPLGAELRASATTGFVLYEDRPDGGPFVAIELPHARVEASAPADVVLYQELYGLLLAGAAPEKDTPQLIREIARSLP